MSKPKSETKSEAKAPRAASKAAAAGTAQPADTARAGQAPPAAQPPPAPAGKLPKGPTVLAQAQREGRTVRVLMDATRVWKEIS